MANLQGVNWPVDIAGHPGKGNYQNAPRVINGLSTSDSADQAANAAETILGKLYSDTGGNTVRVPINEATVSSGYWPTYVGAIFGMLNQGNVILCYWAHSNGKPSWMSHYWSMWNKVVGQFGGNPKAFFEPINEPTGYHSASDLVKEVYDPWLKRYPNVSRDRVLLDGTGLAVDVAAVGALVPDTLLSVHSYPWNSKSVLSESGWASHLAGQIGGYASRTVLTEFGAPMTTGVNYDNEVISGGEARDANCLRGTTDEARRLGIGGVYWPGIGTDDSYRLYTLSGASLTLTNHSGLDRLKYAWGQ